MREQSGVGHGAREASRALRTYEWLSRTGCCEGKNYDDDPVPARLRAGHHTRAEAWCLLIHAEASLSSTGASGQAPPVAP